MAWESRTYGWPLWLPFRPAIAYELADSRERQTRSSSWGVPFLDTANTGAWKYGRSAFEAHDVIEQTTNVLLEEHHDANDLVGDAGSGRDRAGRDIRRVGGAGQWRGYRRPRKGDRFGRAGPRGPLALGQPWGSLALGQSRGPLALGQPRGAAVLR